MSVTVGEFFIDLVVNASNGELTLGNLVKSMGDLEVASVGEIAILAELANKLTAITKASIESAIGLKDYSSSTGASTLELQKWQNAAQHVNVDINTMRHALEGVSHNLAAGKLGNFGALANLSYILKQSKLSLQDFKAEQPEKLLEALRKSEFFQKLPEGEQFKFLSESGLGAIQAALQLKRMSEDQFKTWSEEGPLLREDEIKKWDDVNSSLISVREISSKIKEIIAGWFSEDMQAGLLMTTKLLGAAANAMDPTKEHGTATQFATGVVKDIVNPMQLGRDFYAAGKSWGFSMAQLIDESSAMINKAFPFTPHPSLMAGPLGQKTTINNFSGTVKIQGNPNISEAATLDAIHKGFIDLLQPVAAQSNQNPH